MSILDEPVHYTIKVQGEVDERLVNWFGPVEIACQTETGAQAVTTLSGLVADQAALVGLIRHLHGLGIVLLSMERVMPRPQTPREIE